jgi:hypothetical protein
LFDPVIEAGMDVVDVFAWAGGEVGAWQWDGRAGDSGNFFGWFNGLEDVENAGAMARFRNLSRGLGFDEQTEFYKGMSTIGGIFDIALPGELIAGRTLAKVPYGLGTMYKLNDQLPGIRTAEMFQAAFMPQRKWRELVRPVNRADLEEALEAARQSGDDLQVRKAEARIKDHDRETEGVFQWRTRLGVDRKDQFETYGGMHDLTGLMAMQLVEKNLLQGRPAFEGFGKGFRDRVKETLRVGGIEVSDIVGPDGAFNKTSRMRTAKFFAEATSRLVNADDFTQEIRNLESYQKLKENLELANAGTKNRQRNIRGISAIETTMALLETLAVQTARNYGPEKAVQLMDRHLTKRASDVEDSLRSLRTGPASAMARPIDMADIELPDSILEADVVGGAEAILRLIGEGEIGSEPLRDFIQHMAGGRIADVEAFDSLMRQSSPEDLAVMLSVSGSNRALMKRVADELTERAVSAFELGLDKKTFIEQTLAKINPEIAIALAERAIDLDDLGWSLSRALE